MFGTLGMAHMGRKLTSIGGIGTVGAGKQVATFCLSLFAAGLGLKAALVPCHAWLSDAHPSAPTPISAMFSGVLLRACGWLSRGKEAST